MFLAKLGVTMSLIGMIYCIRCYNGMQGSVNGDSIGEIEVLDCNGTDYCVKLPSTGHVGRKLYEGAQYSCDFGDCRREGCEKKGSGGMICCCSTDECNSEHDLRTTTFIPVLFILLAVIFNNLDM